MITVLLLIFRAASPGVALVIALLGLDVAIDGVCDRLVCAM